MGIISIALTLPLDMNMTRSHAKPLKLDVSKGLHENVSNHVISWTVFDDDMALHDSLVNKVGMHVNVLHVGMEFQVFQELNCTLVITVESSWQGKRVDKRKFFQ